MDQRSWMERTFGESWQTTVAGYGGVVLALPCIILGRVLDVPDLLVAGLAILTLAVGALGQLARSNAASRKVAGQLDRRIENTQEHINQVEDAVKQQGT